jgi:MFS family permease
MASDAVVGAARGLLPGFVPATRFSLPSFAAAALSFAAFAAAAVVLNEPDRERGPARRVTFVSQFREALADAAIRPLVLGFFLASFAFAGVQVMFIPLIADFFGYDATAAALFLTYIGVLGTVNQGVLIGRLSRRFGALRVTLAGTASLCAALVVVALSPTLAGLVPPLGGPAWLTGPLVVLLGFGALASFGNGALTVGLATLVSERTPADAQGTAFGVTQGAASLGRTVGPPLAAGAYVLVYWSPFVAGALVLLPVAVMLWRGSAGPG